MPKKVSSLWQLPSLKLFIALGVFLFHGSAAYSLSILEARGSSTRHLLLHSLVVAFATWLVISLAIHIGNKAQKTQEVDGDPLGWSRASLCGGILFIALVLAFGYPGIEHPSLLSPVSIAFAGVSAATIGIAGHLRTYWELHRSATRSSEALKAEQQLWATVFGGAVAWTGLLISGALLALALGTFGTSVRQLLPNSTNTIDLLEVLLAQGLVIGYTIACTITWLLRPVHRRMEQIVDSIRRG